MSLEFSTEWRTGQGGYTGEVSGRLGTLGGVFGVGVGGGGVRGEGWSDGVLE